MLLTNTVTRRFAAHLRLTRWPNGYQHQATRLQQLAEALGYLVSCRSDVDRIVVVNVSIQLCTQSSFENYLTLDTVIMRPQERSCSFARVTIAARTQHQSR